MNSKQQTLFLDNEKWFKNVSSIDIPSDISDFLSLGPKFSIPITGKEIKFETILADVENIIEETPTNSRDILRARATNIVTNYYHNSQNLPPSPFNTIFNKTKIFLKSHPDLYILQSDKGGCTVAINREDYIQKTQELLQDNFTYTQLTRDPTTSTQTTHNNLIKSLKAKKEISEIEAKSLIIYNASCPKLYCLPKVHKPNIPLRPIVSSINSVTYNLSKFLSKILQTAFQDSTNYNIKDTFTFVNTINGFHLPDNHILISLDVVSLFTNIPLNLIKEILRQKWDIITPHTSLSRESFLKLIDFTFNNTYFSFNNCFYKQIFGTPMGSPISPILATIVLDYLLDNTLPNLPFNIPFIFKYVDDLICAVPSDQVEITLNKFNSFHQKLQFTIEMETDGALPFLDTKVVRTEDNKIILDWYQKTTASGRFINYFSYHPKNQKYNTVIAMKNRVTHISDEIFLLANLKKLFNIFLNNGYPKHILNKLIYNSNLFDGPTEPQNTQVKFKKIPYIKELSHQITGLFRDFPQIQIAKYNTLTNRNLFSKTKDKTPMLYNSNVIYKIPCLECRGCYIGQTSQWLKQRITQHKSDCRVGKNSCAVAEHFQKTGHQFNYDEVKILKQENNYKSRLFLEMYYIKKTEHSLNYKSDTNQLSNIYCNILNLI